MISIRKAFIGLAALLALLFAGLPVAVAQGNADFRIITEEFPPYNYTTSDGKVIGISTEIVREILKRIGHPDNIEVMPWVDGYRIAQKEDNVILFSTTRSPAREKLFKWVGPLVPNNLAFFARKDSGISINNLDDAKKVHAIGVYKDDFGELLLKEKGFTNLDAVIENSMNIPRLLNGKIDLWIANELTGKHMIASAGAANKIRKVFEVQKDYMYIAFSRNTPDAVIERWQRALDEIKSDGTYAQIFSQWIMFSYTEDLKPKQAPELTFSGEEQVWIDEHPVIRIAPDPDYAPFQFRDDAGVSRGIANDFLDLVSRKLGIRFDYLNTGSWEQSLQQVKEHRADMVAVATETPERKEYLRFTAPYVEFPDVILTRAGTTVSSLEELHGKSLATVKGFAINEFLRNNHPQIELVMAPDVASLLQMVSTGEVDATVLNLATTSWAIEKSNITNLHINDFSGFSYKLAFASRKDWPMLQQLLTKGLAAISEEERKAILHKWISVSSPAAGQEAQLELTPMEQAWLAAHPEIRIGVDPDYPPFDFIDEHGAYQGAASDYMHLIGDRLGVRLKLVPHLTWPQVLQGVQDGKVDVIPLLSKTEERSRYLNFTEPYLSFPNVLITRDDHHFVTGLKDLTDETMAVVKGYANTENLSREYPRIKHYVVDSPLAGLNAVATGEADGFVGNLGVTGYLILAKGLTNLKVAAPTDLENAPFSIGVRMDWPELVPILNKALASISEEERLGISRKWVAVADERPVDYTLIWQIVGGMGAVLLLVFLWTVQTQRQKRALRESEEKFRNLYKTALVGLYRTTTDGSKVLLANPALAELFGYDSVEDYIEHFSSKDCYVEPGRREALIKALREEGKVDNFEFVGRRSDGLLRDFLLSGTLYEEQGFLEGAILDITDRKRAEEEAGAAREAAEQANRAKSDFLATMSHEMRTPLNAVLGMAWLALQQELSPVLRNYLNSIQLAARSLLGVISDTLDLSKIEAGKLELEQIDFDLDHVLEGVAVVAGHQAREQRLDFSVRVARDVPQRFIGDPQRLGQVLLNLAGNAVKFTECGSVAIDVAVAERSDEGTCLRFSVSDTGIGLSEEQIGVIFAAFTQADSSTTRRFGGTGLGLSICSRLVEKMGGRLSVESQPAEGSTFSFSACFAHAAQAAADSEQEMSLDGVRMLLAGADLAALFPLSAMFERAGAHVVVIDDAKRVLAGGEFPFDILVLDLRTDPQGWERLQNHLPAESRVVLIGEALSGQPATEGVTVFDGPIAPLGLATAVAYALGRDTQDELQADDGSMTGRRVLLVEDNPFNQQVGRGLLEERGIDVTIASDGVIALQRLQEGEFDLVLMDIQMPGMSGYEVCEKLRREPRFATLPIIAMTADATADARQACLQAGMDDYIAKPIEPERLYELIGRYLKLDEARSRDDIADAVDALGALPGIDTRRGLRLAGGNVDLYSRLLGEFDRHHADDLVHLRAFIDAGEDEAARRLAHTLKGVAGNLGAAELQRLAMSVEEQLPGHVDAAMLDALEREHQMVSAGLARFIAEML